MTPDAFPLPEKEPIRRTAPPPAVLLAEDNSFMAEFLGELFGGRGFRVIAARNGREAVAALECGRIDLIVSDMLMPECDGVELLQARNSLAPDVPMVCLSGGGLSLTPDYLKNVALTLGADAFFAKPVDIGALLDLISRLLPDRRP